jgi:hypothetical protein
MRLPIIALSTCIAVAAMTGCTGLGTSKTDLKTELAKGTTIAPDAPAGTAKVDVIFQPDSGQPQRMERSLTEPTTVQQMLVQSGGLKKYRRAEIEVLRQRPSGGGYFTIPCEYDRETRQIDPANDYALMPGDRLVIKEDKSTIIDDIMKSAGGGLGKRFTTGGKHKAESKYRVQE